MFVAALWIGFFLTRIGAKFLPKRYHFTEIIRKKTGLNNFHHAHFTLAAFLLVISLWHFRIGPSWLVRALLGLGVSLALDQPYRSLPFAFGYLYRCGYWDVRTLSVVVALHIAASVGASVVGFVTGG